MLTCSIASVIVPISPNDEVGHPVAIQVVNCCHRIAKAINVIERKR